MAKQLIKKRAWRIVYWCAVGLFAAVFLFSGAMIGYYYYDTNRSGTQYQELSKMVDEAKVENVADSQAPKKEPMEIYAGIKAQNKDFIGWVAVAGTRVNYPVVQKRDAKDYYLRRGFDGSYSYYGVPYASEACTFEEADNFVIYGHNMDNGSMFSDLVKYTSKSFFESHRYIQFDTVDAYGKYEVIAVFKTVASGPNAFSYHTFSKAKSAAEFDQYVAQCKKRSLYDTGVTAQYGDKLITLSTCEYSRKNGRLAIVAKKIES